MADLIEAAVARLWDCLERDQLCAGVTVKHTDLRIALSLIKHLTAEREKDRQALQEINDTGAEQDGALGRILRMQIIARARLEDTQD